MTSEVPVTPAPAAESVVQATPEVKVDPTPAPIAPPQEVPQPVQPPDWEKAYKGLQTNVKRLHEQNENLLQQNQALAGGLSSLRTGQNELVRATLGEDKAREMAARDAQNMTAEAARRAAVATGQLMETQAGLLLDALQAVGIDPKDPEIDWAQDAGLDVTQWGQRVGASVKAKIQKTLETRIAKEREAIASKSKTEIVAEAEARTARALKESGVDKIDTAKGQATTSFMDRMRVAKEQADKGNPEMLNRMISEAKAGRLRI